MSHIPLPDRTAAQVLERFVAETEQINRYVETARELMGVTPRVINYVHDSLRLCRVRFYKRIKDEDEKIPESELQTIVKAIDQVESRIVRMIDQHDQKHKRKDWWERISPDYHELFQAWLDFCVENVPPDIGEQTEEWKRIEGDFFEMFREGTGWPSDDEPESQDLPDDDELRWIIEEAMREVRVQRLESRVNTLRNCIQAFDRIKFAARIRAPEAEINILRQGFLLLTTAFDAAVFDIARVALRADFFRLCAIFGERDKISIRELSRFVTFDEWRDDMIENALRTHYVRDVLAILASHNIPLSASPTGQTLAEIVVRRNIHVHNRGVVDRRYLETNENGKPKYNIYGLSIGEYATITEAYWRRSNEVMGDCVNSLAKWCRSISVGG